jgi:hypothetical protein
MATKSSPYDLVGAKLISSISAIPMLIPNSDGTKYLYVSKVELSENEDDEVLFSEFLPFEVTINIISALTKLVSGGFETIKTGNTIIDPQLMPVEDLVKQMEETIIAAESIKDHLRKIVDNSGEWES